MGYDDLLNYYKTNWAMRHHHKYTLTELENMQPWERQVYLDLTAEWVKQQNELARDRATGSA
jgi:hypothetical protein